MKLTNQLGKLSLLLGLLFGFACGAAKTINAQKTSCAKPVTMQRLKAALQNKTFQTRQIVETINDCGADFQVTPQIESELVAIGARPQVIEAIRANYRAASNPTPKPGGGGSPMTKTNLLKTLKAKSMSNGAILDAVEKNGVDFETTAAVERELAQAGASPAIIAAVKSSYRAGGGGAAPNFTGSPLSKDAVVALLQNGVADAQVQQNVRTRGVNFKLNAATQQEIRSAGGSAALVNLINASFANPNSGNAGGAGNDYEDYINQALETYNADVTASQPLNSPGRIKALEILQQAVKLNPNNPSAYQQIGFMTLYGTTNGFSLSEQFMKRAVELGGSAVFRVYHDHDGVFSDTCNGSLYVSRDGVRFESDDNRHTFDTTDANIKQVKTNSSWRRAFQTKSGSFKIVLNDQSDKDGKKFSFAPLTDNIEESKMVIRLIGKQ
jgi:hypothetical protein